MKEINFEDWRLTGFWAAMVVAALIAGFVFGWCWRDRSGVLASVSLLSVMTAVGTVGATVVAVAVPMYQNWERKREQRLNQLLAEWAIAEEVHRLSAKIRDTAKSLLNNQTVPSLVKVQHLYSQLEIAKQGTVDRFGVLIIGDLLQLTNVVYAEGESRLNSRQVGPAMGLSAWGRLQDGLRQELDRADQLHESTYRWMQRILVQFEQLKVVPPFIVKGEGSASMSLEIRSTD